MPGSSAIRIVVEESGRAIDLTAGANLLDELRAAGIDLDSIAARVGAPAAG
jgi:hypothetical protein